MAKRLFNKEFFIRSVKYNVRTLFRKEIEEATEQQIFQAVGYAVKDAIMDAWIATQKEYEKSDPKIVYYMSMEFLMGRALGNNLINLTFYDEVKEALEEIGLDLNTIEDQEPDAALGNGGLGRLAACFLDSLATLGYAAYGCGISGRSTGYVAEERQSVRASPSGVCKDCKIRRICSCGEPQRQKHVHPGRLSVRTCSSG